jgi:hypothetical protein
MTQSEHRSPLAPGEIRTHIVGDRAFQVMHVAGGSFTQASVRGKGPSTVLCTDVAAAVAVKAYADAIEQAESDRIDALEGDDEAEDASLLLATIRGQLRQYVPGGGEQRLDRYLMAMEDARAPVTPLEAIAVLRRWAHFWPADGAKTAIDRLEKQIEESL